MKRPSLGRKLFVVIVMAAAFIFNVRSYYYEKQQFEKTREQNQKAFDAQMMSAQHEHDLVEKKKTASPADRKRIDAEIQRNYEEDLRKASPEERNRRIAELKAAIIAQEKYKKASPAERQRIDAENKRISDENVRHNQEQLEAVSQPGLGSSE